MKAILKNGMIIEGDAEEFKVLLDNLTLLSKINSAPGAGAGAPTKKPNRKNKHWSDDDDKSLLSLAGRGTAISHIAKSLGRTRAAVRARLAVLNKPGQSSNGSKRKAWKAEDDKLLIKLYSEKTSPEIGKELGRSPASVMSRIQRLRADKKL